MCLTIKIVEHCNIVHHFFLSTLSAIDYMSMLSLSFFLVKICQPFSLVPMRFPFDSFLSGFSISPLVSCLCFFTFLAVISVSRFLIKDYSNEWGIDPTEILSNNYSSIYYLIILILALLISIFSNLYMYFLLLKYVKNKPYEEINNCRNSSCDVPLTEHEERLLELRGQSSEKGSPESEVTELEKYIISENSLRNRYEITRADKRQLASILDEFWGFIFDYHGNLTKEAKNIGVAVLVDLPACTEADNENLSWGGQNICDISGAPKKQFSYVEIESLVIYSLRICLRKILRLNCSGLLFSRNDGLDERLIEHLAMCEKRNDDACNLNLGSGVSIWINSICGKECVWQPGVVLSFAIWSIRLMLELVGKETRPELWGKYTFVLNRLQGLVDPIFCKPRAILPPCRCLQSSGYYMDNSGMEKITGKRCILELIKEAESFCLKRRGRAGTAAGDIAFPKGKEILNSALGRYKRRLSK